MAEEQRRKILTLASVDTDDAAELADLYFGMYRELLRDALDDDPDIAEIEGLWRSAQTSADRAAKDREY